jgi:zinc finger BED domain-containing protein 1 (E3 SUMO-protein ligase ZBED1)
MQDLYRPASAKSSSNNDELARYMALPREARSVNPLEWWRVQEREFPRVALMAKNYLGIPGSSVPCERIFSKAGEQVTKRRNQLSGNSIRAILCLDSWWRSNGLGLDFKIENY